MMVNLKLTAADFKSFLKRGAENLTKEEDLLIVNDLKTLLEFMIENESEMNIDLDYYETSCGTYRCVAGWWSFYLGEKVYNGEHFTTFFKRVFGVYRCLMDVFFRKYDFVWNEFFGLKGSGNLERRLERIEELIERIPPSQVKIIGYR